MRPSSRVARDAAAGDHVAAARLEMRLVDEDGTVLAEADEPFEVGRFDLAAARQGMRKMLVALGGLDDDAVLDDLDDLDDLDSISS